MLINKKIIVTLSLSSVVALVALTSMKPQDEPGFKNIKVLPKNITHQQLENVMHEWSASLGVHCDFCHARNEAEKKMDFASDAKPEKKMAREMFEMTSKINKKFFKAEKDSLGMVIESSVACVTCHHGSPHPEVKPPAREQRGPGGPPPGGNPPPTAPPSGK